MIYEEGEAVKGEVLEGIFFGFSEDGCAILTVGEPLQVVKFNLWETEAILKGVERYKSNPLTWLKEEVQGEVTGERN